MAANKFWKKKELSSLEQQVGAALTQIEATITEVKNLKLTSVVDFTAKINAKKQVYLVFIPYPCLTIYNKISYYLNWRRELRQLSQWLLHQILKQMIFIILRNKTSNTRIQFNECKRTIESKWVKNHRSQTRPNSRTLTSVYNELLEDLISPSVILGRRTRVRVDGTKFYRIFLDESDQKELESRLDSIKDVYKVLTTRDLEFEFRRDDTFYQKKGAKKVAKK